MKCLIVPMVLVLWCVLIATEAYKPVQVRRVRTRRATTQQNAWVTDLMDESQGTFTFCGGTLVGANRQWVLTSGHCMKNRYVQYIHSKMLANDDDILASKVAIHPAMSSFNNDIAMVKLSQVPGSQAEFLPFWNPSMGDFRYNTDVCHVGIGTNAVSFTDYNTCVSNLGMEDCAVVAASDAYWVLTGDVVWCIHNDNKYMAGLISNSLHSDDKSADRVFGITPVAKYKNWLYQVRQNN